MANYWKTPGVPHRGWSLTDVIDVREDGQPECETDYETCMMCGNERIRYVHVVKHAEVDREFSVGCDCAEKMTNDYVNPKKKEKELRNRVNRKNNWAKRSWKTNSNDNSYLKMDGHYLLIYTDRKTGKYKVKIDDVFGRRSFGSLKEAKSAALDGVEYYKREGRW